MRILYLSIIAAINAFITTQNILNIENKLIFNFITFKHFKNADNNVALNYDLMNLTSSNISENTSSIQDTGLSSTYTLLEGIFALELGIIFNMRFFCPYTCRKFKEATFSE